MSYVSSHLQGGLGNYLFQISAAYGISKRDNKELKIDTSDIAVVHSPLDLYFNNILRNISFGEINYFESIHNSDHSPITFIDIPVINGNLKLDGYYQNEKYSNDKIVRTSTETSKLLKQIRILLEETSWAKHLKEESIAVLRQEIIEQLITTNKSFQEIKRDYL